MNVEKVLKRLEALEGKYTGTEHIESIIVGIDGGNGNPAPCSNPDDYGGKYLVLENRFIKIDRVWQYRPKTMVIDDYRDYEPPEVYKNALICLVRRGEIESSPESRQTITLALEAVATAENDINLKGE